MPREGMTALKSRGPAAEQSRTPSAPICYVKLLAGSRQQILGICAEASEPEEKAGSVQATGGRAAPPRPIPVPHEAFHCVSHAALWANGADSFRWPL